MNKEQKFSSDTLLKKKFKTAETDAGPVFYSRNKNQIEGDYPYCKGENAQ